MVIVLAYLTWLKVLDIRKKQERRAIKGDDITGRRSFVGERWSEQKKRELDDTRFSLKDIMWSPFRTEKAERKLVKDTLECKKAID